MTLPSHVLLLTIALFVLGPGQGEANAGSFTYANLVETEAAVVRALESYIKNEESRLQEVKLIQEDFRRQLQNLNKTTSLLDNPVESFLLVKKLTADWKAAQKVMQDLAEQNAKEKTSKNLEGYTFPSEDDLKRAALTIIRLQETYDLNSSAIVQGKINGSDTGQELTAGDCYELGRQSFYIGDLLHAFIWMAEATKQWGKELVKTVDKVDVLDYYSYLAYRLDDYQLAFDLATEMYKLSPEHPRAIGYVNHSESLLKGEKEKSEDEYYTPATENDGMDNYRSLCRGENLVLNDVKSGGATVFPNIGVSTWPKKGSAAFWYNMKKNGDVDDRTLHSGCPVIYGSKFIGNKWIHEREQVFIRPCSLQ